MPVSRNAHQLQLPATPRLRTRSVTRFGVSVENVVATIENPSSHHDRSRPDRKYSLESLPARRDTHRPTASVMAKKPRTIAQSSVERVMDTRSVAAGRLRRWLERSRVVVYNTEGCTVPRRIMPDDA